MKRFLGKTEIKVGLIVGAILTLAIAGSLDVFLPLGQGGWSGAIRNTILHYLGHPWEEVLALRIFIGLTAMLVLALMGGLMGALFALLISCFFNKMYGFLEKLEKDE